MNIQLDGDVSDVQELKNDLKMKGFKIISVQTSRWIGVDEQGNPVDRGGRIDVEISDDHILKDRTADVIDIQIAMVESEKTTVDGNVQELKKEKEKHKKTVKNGKS